MALPMIAGAMMKGLLGGKSKKTGGALVKTKDAKIKQVRDNQPKVENKASFVGTSEAMYSKVASQKKISASDFKPESQQVKVETEANQETLKTQLDNLIQNTSKLDEVLKKEYKEELANSRKKKSALSKDKAAKREKKLEKKSGGNLLGSALGKASSFNFMDMIGKFLLNTLLGGLALLTMNNLDQIGGFLNKYGGNLYLIFSGLRLGLVGLKGFLKGTLGLGARLFKTGIKTTGKLILKTAKGLGSLFKFGFTKLGDAIVDFARGAINTIRNLAGKPPLPGRPGRSGGRNSTTPGTRLNQKQRTATSSKAARKRYAQRYGDEAAKRRFKGNVSKPSGQSTRLQGKPNKFLQKLFGKKEAKTIAQNKGLFKNIFKGAKGFRIPIVGPFISAIGSMLSGDPVKQTLFKSVGTGLGEALGTLIPIPVVGTILGGLIGEYGGDLLYTFLEGGGISGVQTKMVQDWQNTLQSGANFAQYMKDSWNRYYASLPKINFGIGAFSKEVPDPMFLFNPGKIGENIGLIKNALFPPQDGTPPPPKVVSYGLTDPITGQTLNTSTQTAPGAGPTGTVTGGNADFWTLAAVASLEDGDAQSRADVAQSIYNRAASGAYSSSNIRELIIADGQYQPTWDYPRKNPNGDKANPEWLGIVDAQTAAAATGKDVAFVEQAAREIMNPTLQKNARDFVGGRTDFTNYTKTNRRSEIYRSTGGKNNYFGWDWNYSGTVQGNVPDFGATQSPSSVTPVTQPATTSGITPAQMQQKLAEQTAATEATGYPGQTPTPPAQPKITTAPQQQSPSVSRSASYERQGTIPVVVPLPSPNQQQTSVMSKRSGVPMVGGSTIDMVNSYYKAQLLANLYKQG